MSERRYINAILACLPMSEDGTGHVADCGWTYETEQCGCGALPGLLGKIIREIRADERAKIADLVVMDGGNLNPFNLGEQHAARIAEAGEQS